MRAEAPPLPLLAGSGLAKPCRAASLADAYASLLSSPHQPAAAGSVLPKPLAGGAWPQWDRAFAAHNASDGAGDGAAGHRWVPQEWLALDGDAPASSDGLGSSPRRLALVDALGALRGAGAAIDEELRSLAVEDFLRAHRERYDAVPHCAQLLPTLLEEGLPGR